MSYHWLRKLLFYAAVISFFGGCDPGISYHPEGWGSSGQEGRWQRSFGDLEIVASEIFGFAGSESLSIEFVVINHSSLAVTLESAILVGRTESATAKIAEDGKGRRLIAQPGASKEMGLYLEFKDSVGEVLGKSPRLTLNFNEGGRTRVIEIIYAREPIERHIF